MKLFNITIVTLTLINTTFSNTGLISGLEEERHHDLGYQPTLRTASLTPINPAFTSIDTPHATWSVSDRLETLCSLSSEDISSTPSIIETPHSKCSQRNTPTKYILSLDGGGVRGILELYFLKELESALGKPIGEVFDFVAGTSIGAITARGLTHRNPKSNRPMFTANELYNLMITNSDQMTKRKHRSLFGLVGPKYRSTPVKALLTQQIGQAAFSQTTTPTIAVAQNLTTLHPIVFKSYDSSSHVRAVDALLATSAAGTFYKPHTFHTYTDPSHSRIQETYRAVDGGTVANNPTLLAIQEAKKLFPDTHRFVVISLGTGNFSGIDEGKNLHKKSHILKWAAKMPKIAIHGQMNLTDHLLRNYHSEGVNIYRWNPTITGKAISLDDSRPETLKKLIAAAQKEMLDKSDLFHEITTELQKNQQLALESYDEDTLYN